MRSIRAVLRRKPFALVLLLMWSDGCMKPEVEKRTVKFTCAINVDVNTTDGKAASGVRLRGRHGDVESKRTHRFSSSSKKIPLRRRRKEV